jgi:ribosomal protein S18 acetylase RimI-like enzyme
MSSRSVPVVRTALRSDLEHCAELFARGQQEIEPRTPPWRSTEFMALVDGEDLFVAAAGPAIVGFVSLWRVDAFIHFLHVAPAWRRCGVGRQLLAAARAETHRPLELKCLVGNSQALAFYCRLGWRAINQSVDPPAPYVRLRLSR